MVSDSDSIQLCELNLSVLDDLVLEVLKVKPLKVCKLEQIRAAIADGQLEEALALLSDTCPALIEDGRYKFKLTKQKFCEKIQKGEESSALYCARKELAPMALDAYPEAYLEFKQSMKLLISGREGHLHLSSAETMVPDIQSNREDLASSVYHAARRLLDIKEPQLIPLLTYLLYLRHIHCSTTADRLLTHEQDLADQLLPRHKPRDQPSLPLDNQLSAAQVILKEADVQALIQCTGAPRRNAMEALRHAQGDVQKAFCDELARMPLNRSLLLSLVHEYVAFRGLEVDLKDCMEPDVSRFKDVAPLGEMAMELCGRAGSTVQEDCAARGRKNWLEVEEWVKGRGAATAVEDSSANSSCSIGTSHKEEASPNSISSLDESGGSWSVRRHLQALQPFRSRSQSPPNKVPRFQGGEVGEGLAHQLSHGKGSAVTQYKDIHDKLGHLTRLFKGGRIEDIEHHILSMDPGFFESHPDHLFSLRHCRVLQLLSDNETARALGYLRSKLAPVAVLIPSMQAKLKRITSLLLDPSDLDSPEVELHATSIRLQSELRVRMGMHGPMLMKLLQVLLGVHRAWLKQEKYTDPFQMHLRLAALRQPIHVHQPHSIVSSEGAEGHSSPGRVVSVAPSLLPSLVGSASDSDNEEVEADEEGVLRIMEILELPRSAAIDLLLHHGGDVEVAIMSAFG
ncbi:hypothetical protein CEUSTIGMA_g7257.t1 [Chlamydomonas eustigma]|uniref:CTLH domain-containing protein n=1 Tax=Chlamydomonas eustigma TaxID=1157962 RepID=A0A250X9S6_9CHLO|nr:hypothetical protein CEUSTIGMA_g7257.t1 [Chlamydomonas eustigma]|eukprot:GAX79817.1 hypothetical protein CEUSTIGMA_g7257.t1 [Chlamydomonas eustigma]